MQVPLLDLKAQYATIKAEVREAVEAVFDSQYFILGPEVERLERNIAAYTGAKYAVGVSSGTDALLVGLTALGVGPGDEVITTPFTFFSTAGVVPRLSARPVFVDIDPVTFNLAPERIEAAVTPRTKAIIPVHLFGQCADMDPILEVARRHAIPVLEDAAQSIGAEYKGKKAGSMGTMGIFSFFPSKNLGGCGDGGMVVTDDAELYQKLLMLRVHGSGTKYYHHFVGGNFRLDALQAAVLNVKLRYLDLWSRKRRENAAEYGELFHRLGLEERGLITPPRAVYPESGNGHNHIFNQYTLRARSRDRLRAFLRESRIGTEVYYPIPLHLQECFQELGFRSGDFPSAEQASEEVLSLPIYPELTAEQKGYVAQKIAEFYGQG